MAEQWKRVPPSTPDDWSEATKEVLEATFAPVAALEGGEPAADARPLNILRTIAHHPTLLPPFLQYSATLAAGGVLSRRSSELLALRAAWNCRSDFEWAHHVAYALAAGLDDDEIARIPRGPEAPGWSDADRELLRAADELHAGHDWSEATWQALRARYSEAELVEIPFVVGQYTMLSMVANATGVAVEEGLPGLPDASAR